MKKTSAPIIPSAALNAWYYGQLRDLIDAMAASMELHIEAQNTQVRAADVEVKHRANRDRALSDAASRTRDDVTGISNGITAQPPQTALPPFPPMPSGGQAPPVPGGLAPGVPQGAMANGFDPTAIGAQQAPDGNHYLPDPKRPGKYLMVVH